MERLRGETETSPWGTTRLKDIGSRYGMFMHQEPTWNACFHVHASIVTRIYLSLHGFFSSVNFA